MRMQSERRESMSRRRRGRIAGGVVASLLVVASGAACELGDAGFDPGEPPEILLCSEVGQGQTLRATASLDGSVLEVRIRHEGNVAAVIVSPAISDVEDATFVEFRTEAPDLVVVLDVGSPPSVSGRFTISGQLQGSLQTCPVQRTFVFTIAGGDVTVT